MGIMYQGSAGALFGPAGTNHSQGMVVDPGSISDTPSTHRFLRSDATWDQVDYSSLTGTPAPGVVNFVLLNTLTASNSATLSDTSSLTSTYSIYDIVFENIIPATTSVTLELQAHSGGSFQATTYLNATHIWSSAADSFAGATTFVQLSGSANLINSQPGLSGTVRIYAPSGTVAKKPFTGQTTHLIAGGGALRGVNISGYWDGGTGAVDGFQILASTGNLTSGTVKVYGIT